MRHFWGGNSLGFASWCGMAKRTKGDFRRVYTVAFHPHYASVCAIIKKKRRDGRVHCSITAEAICFAGNVIINIL